LTNTSQGGSMDYMNVPKSVLDLAVNVSKAAKAEYWACDVAYGRDGKVRILECATAFAAFPYIRDWIGQYIMWNLSEGRFKKPHTPMFNWEELGKMDPSILRTLRHITFGNYSPSYDGEYFGNKKKNYGGKKVYLHKLDQEYKMTGVKRRYSEEWPSEIYNYQDKLALKSSKSLKVKTQKSKDVPNPTGDETQESASNMPTFTKEQMSDLLTSIDGIGKKKVNNIFEYFGDVVELVGALSQNPSVLTEVKGITKKLADSIAKEWKKIN
jgi:hypothetical protein